MKNGTPKTKAVRQQSVVGVANHGYLNEKNSLSREWSDTPSHSTFYGGVCVEVDEGGMYEVVDGSNPTISTSASDVGDVPEKDANIVYYQKGENDDGVKINPSMFPEASIIL